MANNYKNIIITPNRSSNTADPKVVYSGGNTTANTDITLNVYPDSNGTLSWDGSAGQLFSITNDLSNNLFGVNDVSGIPYLEVYANGLVSVAAFGGNVVIGNTAEFILSPGTGLHANGSFGTAGQALTTNGSAVYWSTPSAGVNTAAQYTWTNTHTFQNTITFGANLIVDTTSVRWVGNTTTSPTVTIANTGAISVGNSSTTQTTGQILVQNTAGLTTINAGSIQTTTVFANVSGNNGTFSGLVNASSLNVVNQTNTATLFITTSANIASSNVIANTAGLFVTNTTGVVNAAVHSVGTSFIANTTQVTISGIPLSANGSVGTAGQVLTTNGATGAPYWTTAAAGVNTAATYTWTNAHTYQNTVTFNSNVLFRNNATTYVGNTTGNGSVITLYVYPDSNGTLSWEGNAGQLFSITNDLSNNLFGVNDVSGIPYIEVYANGLVSVAPISGNVGVRNTAPSHTMSINGDLLVNTDIDIGNSSVNAVVNSTAFLVGNITTGTGGLQANTTRIFVGNNTINAAVNTTTLSIGGTLIANSTGPYGKTEGNLNVNNATTAYGKTEGNLNVNSAVTLTTARNIGDVSFNGSAAIVPERITFKDTRGTNYNPFSYAGITLHLKTNTTDSLTDGGTYHGVLDLQHWSDSSGGVNHQLGLTDNGNMYIRYSTGASSWSSWNIFLNSSNYNSYAPTLTGTGASGTWSININGSAASATNASAATNATFATSAGTANTTQALTFASDGTGAAATTTFNGGTARVISYNSVGAPSTSGTNASGTWSININGSAASATNASAATNASFATNATSATNASYQGPTGTSNDWVTSFQNTPAHYTSFREMSANGPSGTWWFMENMRHSNGTNYWGRQNAWGWEDNANEYYSRNISGGTFGSWVRFLNSSNYNSYSPTLTGTGASGTWSININGSAASVSSVSISALPSGSWTLLNTLTASNSSALNDTTNFTSSYTLYAIVFQNILPVNNGTGLNMTVRSGGVFQTSSYSGATNISNAGTSAHTPGGAFSTAISLSSGNRMSNAASGGFDGVVYLQNPSQTSSYKQIWGHGTYWDQSGGAYYSGWNTYCAWRGGTGAITGVQFAISSGNISSGVIRIYGIKA